MKAIIFTSWDANNHMSKWAVTCQDNQIQETMEQQQKLCSEIINTEIINCYPSK